MRALFPYLSISFYLFSEYLTSSSGIWLAPALNPICYAYMHYNTKLQKCAIERFAISRNYFSMDSYDSSDVSQ